MNLEQIFNLKTIRDIPQRCPPIPGLEKFVSDIEEKVRSFSQVKANAEPTVPNLQQIVKAVTSYNSLHSHTIEINSFCGTVQLDFLSPADKWMKTSAFFRIPK